VVASEPKASAAWDEAKVKTLTGGDAIRARFVRCDEFEYIPAFKLVIHGNNKPSLRRVDEAIRRRLHLVPFTQKIDAEERILDFDIRLQPEWPGILRWAVQGCLDWRRQGLNPPRSVVEATEEYLSSQDALGRWLEERCLVSPQAGSTRASVLHQDYSRWAEQQREYALSQVRFSQELVGRGFIKRTSNGVLFDGIAIWHKTQE